MAKKTRNYHQLFILGAVFILTVSQGILGQATDGNTADIPDLIVRIAPIYPDRARARGVEGYVVVAYDIGTNGSVVEPHVIDSSPERIFDQAALDAVMKWKYNPRIVDGEPVVVAGMQSKINFSLRE